MAELPLAFNLPTPPSISPIEPRGKYDAASIVMVVLSSVALLLFIVFMVIWIIGFVQSNKRKTETESEQNRQTQPIETPFQMFSQPFT